MKAKELKEELVKVASEIDTLLSEITEEATKEAAVASAVATLRKEAQEKEASEQRGSLDMGTLGEVPGKGTSATQDFVNFLFS